VAGTSALADPGGAAAMAHPCVPFPGDAAMRRSGGISDVLRSRGLPALLVATSFLGHLAICGSGVCGRVDVGLGNVRLPDSSGRSDIADALAAEADFASGGRLIVSPRMRQFRRKPSHTNRGAAVKKVHRVERVCDMKVGPEGLCGARWHLAADW